jgi:hypothetical protein
MRSPHGPRNLRSSSVTQISSGAAILNHKPDGVGGGSNLYRARVAATASAVMPGTRARGWKNIALHVRVVG